MFHRRERSAQSTASNRTQRDNAKIVLDKIIPFYLKGNIPKISEKSGYQKIVELVENDAKIQEIPVDHSSSPGVLAKLKNAGKYSAEDFSFVDKDKVKMQVE